MFPEWLFLFVNVRLCDLVRHVLVGDLRDGRKEEDSCQTKDKDSDREVHPLHALEGTDAVSGVGKENKRGERGGDDSADAIEGLSEVDTDLRVLRRTAD